MIERCNYCQKVHETEPEGPMMFMGKHVKVCPEADDEDVILFSPADFVRFIDGPPEDIIKELISEPPDSLRWN